MDFARRIEISLSQDEALAAVRDALADQGFGVLTEIDMAATFKAKLDVVVPPQVILGACNPKLAIRAVSADPRVATLLPCNVVVRQEHGHTVVEALDPALMGSLSGAKGIDAVASEAAGRIQVVLDEVAAAAAAGAGTG